MESLCENCILYGFCNGRCGELMRVSSSIPIPFSMGKKSKTITANILTNLKRYPDETLHSKQQENLYELQTL